MSILQQDKDSDINSLKLLQFIELNLLEKNIFPDISCIKIELSYSEALRKIQVQAVLVGAERQNSEIYHYILLKSPFDAGKVPDIFEEAMLLKTETSYILQCRAGDIEKERMTLMEFFDLTERPRNYDVLIKRDAIKKMRKALSKKPINPLL